jgi:hypothetical protein
MERADIQMPDTIRAESQKSRVFGKGRWVNPFGIHGTSPALRKTAAEPRCRAEGRGATLKPTRASAKLTAAMTLGEDGRRCSGRSKQHPYGILQRQYVWVKKAGASSRTPQNRGGAAFGVRRLAAAFTGAAEARTESGAKPSECLEVVRSCYGASQYRTSGRDWEWRKRAKRCGSIGLTGTFRWVGTCYE